MQDWRYWPHAGDRLGYVDGPDGRATNRCSRKCWACSQSASSVAAGSYGYIGVLASPTHVVASFLQFLVFCMVIWASFSPSAKVCIPCGASMGCGVKLGDDAHGADNTWVALSTKLQFQLSA